MNPKKEQQHQDQRQVQQEQQSQHEEDKSPIIEVKSGISSTVDNQTSSTLTSLKVMTTLPQDAKVTVTPAPQQDIKTMAPGLKQENREMPLKHVSPNTHVATQNNEIIPSDPVLLLQQIRPPTQDFIPGEPKKERPADTRVTGLSRKETFSWALRDYNSQ